MYFSIHNRRLLSGMVAGAVALAGASACSRSDRASAGRDSTQTGAVAPADTQANPSTSASAQPNTATQPTTGAQPSSADTATAALSPGKDTASSQNTKAGHRHRRPRSSAARASRANGDQGVVGYKAMGQDSSTASANDTAAVASVTDTAVKADTTASEVAGAAPMARDTSVELAQSDTAARAPIDTASQAQADTATIGDTAVILTHADTTHQTEVAVGDSNASKPAERVHPDTLSRKADELAKHEPARVRPPADSTELHGNVTTDRSAANTDAAAVGAAGVASTGNIVTGAEAVAQMTREGEPCSVAATDEHRDVLWDMASSPATLNPCGTGTMTLPKIWTGEKK